MCVDWKQRVNAVLERTLGYQLSKPLTDRAWRVPPPVTFNKILVRATGYQLSRPLADRAWKLPATGAGRLLTAPVFIFSSPRSGSTLLRVILGSHSELYAPPELPLKHLGVRAETEWIKASLDGLELTTEDLEHMLWDRVLAEALRRSGKPRLVVKTPSNVLVWERIAACWPDAQYVYLLRHPAAVARLFGKLVGYTMHVLPWLRRAPSSAWRSDSPTPRSRIAWIFWRHLQNASMTWGSHSVPDPSCSDASTSSNGTVGANV